MAGLVFKENRVIILDNYIAKNNHQIILKLVARQITQIINDKNLSAEDFEKKVASSCVPSARGFAEALRMQGARAYSKCLSFMIGWFRNSAAYSSLSQVVKGQK